MKTKIVISLALAGFLSGQNLGAQHNAEIRLLLQEGRSTEAEGLLNRLPDYEGKKFDLAYTLLWNGKVSESSALVAPELLSNPKDASFTALQGAVALFHKHKEEAVLSFDKAAKLGKKNPSVFETIGQLCLNANPEETALAQKYVIEGLALHNQASALHALQGDIYLAGKDFGEAANSYQRALHYNSFDAQSQRKIGLVYTTAKNYAQALEAFQKCVQMNPQGTKVHQDMGDLFYLFGKYAEAEKAYATYMAKTTPTQEDLERYAFTLFYCKKYAESTKLIESAIEKTERPAVLYRLKGYMAHEMNQNQAGLELMEKFFQLQTQENILPSDYGYYGRILAEMDQDSLAIVQLEKAVQADTTSMEYMDDLAKACSKDKQHQKAILLYEQMIRMGADPAAIYFSIGKEWYFLGDEIGARIQTENPNQTEVQALTEQKSGYYTNAAEAFMLIRKYSPNYAGGYLWCGRVHSLLDPEATREEAKQNYEAALALLEKGDVQKNKKMIVECLKYLGSFYYLASEKVDANTAQIMRQNSVDYFSKVLQYNPEDAQSIEVIEKLKN